MQMFLLKHVKLNRVMLKKCDIKKMLVYKKYKIRL